MADSFTGFIYEIFILIAISILLILIYGKYREKKHQLTLFLFVIFLFYELAIFFSWIAKYLMAFENAENITTNDANYWIISRITGFRFSFVFVTLATYMVFRFAIQLFDQKPTALVKHGLLIFGVIIVIYCIVAFDLSNILLDVIAFLLVFLYMLIIYGSFMAHTIKLTKTVGDPGYKRAFTSLTWMAAFFISTLLWFLLDRVMILMGSPGYTVFYFLAWLSVVIGIVFAYLGYIRPKSKQ